MPRVFVCIAVLSMLTGIAHAQYEAHDSQGQAVEDDPQESGEPEVNLHEELFKQSFITRRKEHLEAVQNLRKMDSYERLYKMVIALAEKLIEVIVSSRNLLENAGFDPKKSPFPDDPSVRDALSTVLENMSLMGDIILHLPHIAHRILKANERWKASILWSLNFANRTRYLLDSSTLAMIHLMGQELNVTKRDPGYFNPYWPKNTDETGKKKYGRKEKRKRGPQIIKFEL